MIGKRLFGRPGNPRVGIFVKIASLEVAELVAASGVDFVVIDAEHAPIGPREVYDLVFAYGRLGVAPIVRVSEGAYSDAQRALDAGALGIFVPHVSDAAGAATAVAALRHPPHGTRGAGFGSRAGRWGSLEGGVAEYVRFGEQECARIAMVEDHSAIDALGDILSTPGLDAVFIGPGDLSLSLGVEGGDRKLHETITRCIARAVAAGVPVGTMHTDPDVLRLRADQGCSFLVVGNDTGIFGSGVRETLSQVRRAISNGSDE